MLLLYTLSTQNFHTSEIAAPTCCACACARACACKLCTQAPGNSRQGTALQLQLCSFCFAGSLPGLAALTGLQREADRAPALRSHSWVTVSTAGHVTQLASLSEQHHQLLAALQHVMSRDPAVAPLSGCDLAQYRAPQDQSPSRRLQPAEGEMLHLLR